MKEGDTMNRANCSKCGTENMGPLLDPNVFTCFSCGHVNVKCLLCGADDVDSDQTMCQDCYAANEAASGDWDD